MRRVPETPTKGISVKKTRDKKFGLTRETVRELTSPEDKEALGRVVGGSCGFTSPSTHCSNYCVEEQAP
jgi:hypothetical protein